MNQLMLTIGLPYSGKTQWAKGHDNWPIVNPDSIRLATHGQRYQPEAEALVWAMAKIFVRSLFLAGHDTVVVDATHNTKKRRDFWIDDFWQRYYVVMDIAKDCCIARAQKAEDSIILPVIERMAEERELDEVYYSGLSKDDLMEAHISNPDGIIDLQLYHQGLSTEFWND